MSNLESTDMSFAVASLAMVFVLIGFIIGVFTISAWYAVALILFWFLVATVRAMVWRKNNR